MGDLLVNPRSTVFWLSDFLKGDRIRKHYEDIKYLLENNSSIESIGRRQKYLERILCHATTTTQFYNKYKGVNDLSGFPVVNKSTIKENIDSFISADYKKRHLKSVTTSGSTGMPFKIYKDPVKLARHTAENIYFSELAGYNLGTKLYYLRVWNKINRKGPIKSFFQNVVMQDADDISSEKIANFFSKLSKDNSEKSIISFSSTCEGIARYIEESDASPLSTKINTLITISETLPEHAKKVLRRTFQCNVISRYSNMENGFIAQQCIKENNEYHINTASFYIEILDMNNNFPVKEGEMGRIVVTDFFNYSMPFIRYDTGDVAVFSESSLCGNETPVFQRIEGRRVDFIYDTKGHLLSPHIVTNTMWKYYPVRQFQFFQDGEIEYNMKLNCGSGKLGNEKELLLDLKKYLGDDARITIEYVSEIPLLASGKRKKIVNNYRQ